MLIITRRSILVSALLFAALLPAGCAGLKSGMSSTTSYFKAGAAETQGDQAYEMRDYAGARGAYQAAAEAGGAYGQFRLANMYLAGEGGKRDPGQYLHWMEQSAAQGYAPANYLMGIAYLPHNAQTARRYLETAARDEHGAAMHMLGLMHASGTGAEQSDREALRWFRLAKAQGIPVEDRFLSASGVQAYMRQVNQQAARARQDGQARSAMVREIQQILTDLGYAPGPVDGLFGGKTRSAIEAFQREKGLSQDGLPTQNLLEALKNAR